jgi:hypothetical protein
LWPALTILPFVSCVQSFYWHCGYFVITLSIAFVSVKQLWEWYIDNYILLLPCLMISFKQIKLNVWDIMPWHAYGYLLQHWLQILKFRVSNIWDIFEILWPCDGPYSIGLFIKL